MNIATFFEPQRSAPPNNEKKAQYIMPALRPNLSMTKLEIMTPKKAPA
jgi:hypothetical protein